MRAQLVCSWCRSQARINEKDCGRKGIRCEKKSKPNPDADGKLKNEK